MKVVMIGAGNVATQLSKALHQSNVNILQVYSRTLESATELAQKVNSKPIFNLNEIVANADLYLFSLKDDALSEVMHKMPSNNGLWVHTSGSMPQSIFKNHSKRYGVFYPFQTFSKAKDVSFAEIPFFIEAATTEDMYILQQLAKKISKYVYFLASERRKYIHLAGVFACNFVNHMYALSEKILKEQEIPFEIIYPLIQETTDKIQKLSPQEAQTGPAIRYDLNIIDKHISLLDNPLTKKIYETISQSIHDLNKQQL